MKHFGVRAGDLKGGMVVSPTPVFNDPVINKKITEGKLVMFKIKKTDLLKNNLITDFGKPNHEAVQPINNMKVF